MEPAGRDLDGAAPIALLIDDGFGAAASWDARLRTADDIVARAEADNRGVAIIPLGEATRDISLATPAAARVRLKQLKPKPHAVERADALPAISRLLAATPDMEVIWLSDGTDLGRGSEFVAGLARSTEGRTVSVVTGGLPTAHALAAADNAAGALTVKVLRASTGGTEDGIIRALDLKGLPLGEGRFAFKDGRTRDRRRDRSAGRDQERHRAAGNRRRALGRRRAAARQALAPPHRRRRLGLDLRYRAAAARLDLLSRARAQSVRRRAARRCRGSPAEAVRRFIEQNVPMIMLADVGNVSGEARDRLIAWIEDGGMLVRFAGPRLAGSDDDLVPVKLRRGGRILGGSLSWDQPQQLAGLLARKPVLRHGGADRRHRHPPGAGRARSQAWPSAPGRRSPTARRSSPRPSAARA